MRRYWPNQDPLGKRITFGPPPGATDTTVEGVDRGRGGRGAHQARGARRRGPGAALPALPPAAAADPDRGRAHHGRPGRVRHPDAARRAVGRSGPAHRERPYHGGADRPVGRAAAAVDAAAQPLLRHRARAGVGRHLRAHELLGGAALARARRAHRPRRRALRRAAAGASAGDVARSDRHRDRGGRRLRPDAADRESALRCRGPPIPPRSLAWRRCSGVTALAANLVPALRATRVDPAVVLREE